MEPECLIDRNDFLVIRYGSQYTIQPKGLRQLWEISGNQIEELADLYGDDLRDKIREYLSTERFESRKGNNIDQIGTLVSKIRIIELKKEANFLRGSSDDEAEDISF